MLMLHIALNKTNLNWYWLRFKNISLLVLLLNFIYLILYMTLNAILKGTVHLWKKLDKKIKSAPFIL